MKKSNTYRKSKNKRINATTTVTERELAKALRSLNARVGWNWLTHVEIHGYYPDFYEPNARIALEVDGGYHLRLDAQWHDRQREAALQALDIVTYRGWNGEVQTDAAKVANRVATFFRTRGSRLEPQPQAVDVDEIKRKQTEAKRHIQPWDYRENQKRRLF